MNQDTQSIERDICGATIAITNHEHRLILVHSSASRVSPQKKNEEETNIYKQRKKNISPQQPLTPVPVASVPATKYGAQAQARLRY